MDINSIGSSTDLTARVAQQQNQAVQNTQNTQEERRAAESARTAVSGDERETNGARTAQPPAQQVQPARPVVNSQGQTIGTNISLTA